MNFYQLVEEIKKEIPTDSSGKWVALDDVHRILERYLIPKFDLEENITETNLTGKL